MYYFFLTCNYFVPAQSHLGPAIELESEAASLRAEVALLREAEAARAEAVRNSERDLVDKCDRLEAASVQVQEMEKMLLAKNVELAESLAKTQVSHVFFSLRNKILEEFFSVYFPYATEKHYFPPRPSRRRPNPPSMPAPSPRPASPPPPRRRRNCSGGRRSCRRRSGRRG